MNRTEVEARIWAITGRSLTGRQVDEILDAAVIYAIDLTSSGTVPTPDGTELYPVISVLARAMLGDDAGAEIRELRRAS